MGKKDDDCANAFDDAVGEETVEIAFREHAADFVFDEAYSGFDPAHGDFGKAEDGPEDGKHDRREEGPAADGVEGDAVDLVGEGFALVAHLVGGGTDGAADGLGAEGRDLFLGFVVLFDEVRGDVQSSGLSHAGEMRLGLGAVVRFAEELESVGLGTLQTLRFQLFGEIGDGVLDGGVAFPSPFGSGGEGEAEGLFELDDTFAAGGLTGDDGDAEFVGEDLRVEAKALGFGAVDLVEGDDDGEAKLDELKGEWEVTFEAGGIDDTDDELRGFFSVEVA